MTQDPRIETVARCLFENSLGGQTGMFHWPGDPPKLYRNPYFEDDQGPTRPVNWTPEGCEAVQRLIDIATKIVGALDAAASR